MGKKDAAKRAPPVASETLELGDGTTFPNEGQSLTVHYTGTLAADGSEFDSSRHKGVPFTFVLGAGKVIKGWEIGLATMSLGQRSRLAISAEAGYGKRGCEDRANASGSGVVPPHADLIFDVALLDIDDRRGVATEARLQAYAKTLDAWVASKMDKVRTIKDRGSQPATPMGPILQPHAPSRHPPWVPCCNRGVPACKPVVPPCNPVSAV